MPTLPELWRRAKTLSSCMITRSAKQPQAIEIATSRSVIFRTCFVVEGSKTKMVRALQLVLVAPCARQWSKGRVASLTSLLVEPVEVVSCASNLRTWQGGKSAAAEAQRPKHSSKKHSSKKHSSKKHNFKSTAAKAQRQKHSGKQAVVSKVGNAKGLQASPGARAQEEARCFYKYRIKLNRPGREHDDAKEEVLACVREHEDRVKSAGESDGARTNHGKQNWVGQSARKRERERGLLLPTYLPTSCAPCHANPPPYSSRPITEAHRNTVSTPNNIHTFGRTI